MTFKESIMTTTFFDTRKQAREFALANGMNTSSVIDFATVNKNVKVGQRWAVKKQVKLLTIKKPTAEVTILLSGDGIHKRHHQVTVKTKKVRTYSLPLAA